MPPTARLDVGNYALRLTFIALNSKLPLSVDAVDCEA